MTTTQEVSPLFKEMADMAEANPELFEADALAAMRRAFEDMEKTEESDQEREEAMDTLETVMDSVGID